MSSGDAAPMLKEPDTPVIKVSSSSVRLQEFRRLAASHSESPISAKTRAERGWADGDVDSCGDLFVIAK